MFKNSIFLDSKFFSDNKEKINMENLQKLKKITYVSVLILLGLLIVSLFVEGMADARIPYLCMMLASLVTAGCLILIERTNRLKSVNISGLPIFYLYYSIFFAFAIYAAVFVKEQPSSVTFCVMLVLLPGFSIDREWRISLYLIIVTCIYLFCGIYFDSGRFGLANIVDGIAYLIVGIVVYAYRVRLNVRNIENQSRLNKKIETDALTQLYNRSALEKRVSEYVTSSKDTAAFILMDVDNFKGINDNFGHAIGDDLLFQTATLLKSQFRRSDYIGRLGGDEFVVFLPQASNREWLEERMKGLGEEMEKTFIGDEAVCTVSGSIGIAMYPVCGTTFEELYKNADAAMYDSKRSGKNRYTFYADVKGS